MRDRMTWKLALMAALIIMGLAGCSVILPSHAGIIDEHAGNALAVNDRVQADPNLPAEVKQWWAAEARTWKWMSDWAHGRIPTPAGPTSQPASPACLPDRQAGGPAK